MNGCSPERPGSASSWTPRDSPRAGCYDPSWGSTVTELPGASAWALDPVLAYLNHGGFGAAPVQVQAEQQTWRTAMERNPAGFLAHELPDLLGAVRRQVAEFLNADQDGIVFTDNATTGLQTVIAQARLGPGDEVLITDHYFPPVLTQLRRIIEPAGAMLRIQPVPLPAESQQTVADAVLSGLTSATRLAVIDHIASCSGMVFPVDRIVAECRRRQIPVLVDGAHAPGQVPVDLTALDPDFWVGNLHKWPCAPKSSAVLYAARHWRHTLRPLVASHRFADGYQPAFDWTGTRDPSALLAVPAALAFFRELGWPAVWQHNNELAQAGAELVAKQIGTSTADGDGLTAAMRLVKLPGPLEEAAARALERELREQYGVVLPITYHGGWQWLRLSAQLYNTIADYERLAQALSALL
jgi:isopenicillin-N epimerase